MKTLTPGQDVTISTLALAYSDYKNVQGTLLSVEGESVKVALPLKALCEEDERELHKEGGKVHVKVPTKLLV